MSTEQPPQEQPPQNPRVKLAYTAIDETLGWIPASNGVRHRHWFIFHHERVRTQQGKLTERYYMNTNGQLIRFGSCESARRKANELNRAAD